MSPPTVRPPRSTRRPDGSLYVVTGASRTGKTAWTAQHVAQHRRMLVWDSLDEWSLKYRCIRLTSLVELAHAVVPRAPDRRIALCVPVSRENFERFCRLAWIFIRVRPGALVVEELADVTSPGKAPLYWGEIIRKGLRYGPSIYALTQRPSESDKTVMGNVSVIHTHQMARADDSLYMARELRVPVSTVDALEPLDWIERDRRTKTLTTGRLRARRHKK